MARKRKNFNFSEKQQEIPYISLNTLIFLSKGKFIENIFMKLEKI